MTVANDVYQQRYRIEHELATGGMGTVFAATDERLDRRVAIKVLATPLAADAKFVERFRREARSVAALSHPNIANVFDYGEDDGKHFIVMELAEGRDLARILREDGPLAPARAAGIAQQICAALQHAHAAGTIHRDIKPANVVVGPDDRVKVTDFGIARATGDTRLTVTGSMMGTAHYISPEQAAAGVVTPASDIYSLGIVLFEMLTGAVPFTGDSLTAVALRHINETVPPPTTIDPSIPAELDAVVLKATAKDPKDRFTDARALEDALAGAAGITAAAGDAGTTASLPTAEATSVWPIPGQRWDPQRVGLWVLGIFGALALVAALLLLIRLGDNDGARAGAGAEATEPATERDLEPSTFTMPPREEVIGANREELSNVLEDEGFTVKLVRVDPKDFGVHDEVAEGEVVGSAPAPGEEVERGTTITLYVSAGEDDDDDDDEGKGGRPDHAGDKGKGKGKD